MASAWPCRKGFYIDAGANDPSIHSVTKVFYERGWHGINIEPLSEHIADLQRERPRDINLRCAAGSSEGESRNNGNVMFGGWASVDRGGDRKPYCHGGIATHFTQVFNITLVDKKISFNLIN